MSENTEQEARNLGWVPQEEFRGDPGKWVDAETFVERGHTIMPILKSNNKKLEEQLRSQAAELERMKGLFNASQESIQALQEVHAESTKKAVERARKELLAELKEARDEGDIEREHEINEELDELKQKAKDAAAAPKKADAPATPPQQQVHPDFAPWVEANPWFGVDQRKTLRAMGIAQQLRADPDLDHLQGKPFFDKILEVMNEGTTDNRTSKVGESRPSGGGSGGGKKSFADLPAEAKEACDRQAKRLVGEGRAFKDMNAWRAHYVNLFYQGETA